MVHVNRPLSRTTATHRLAVAAGGVLASTLLTVALAPVTSQASVAPAVPTVTARVNPAATVAAAVGTYDNASIADIALSYVGQDGSAACADAGTVGDGECKAFVNCIVSMASGGSQWPVAGNGYEDGFRAAGGILIAHGQAVKGDIIQVDSTSSKLHTAIVLKTNGTDSYDVVDSNWVGHHLVGTHTNYTPPTTYTIWRMGTVKPVTKAAPQGDFYVVNTAGSTNTEAHAMSKSSGFKTYTEHAVTALGKVSSSNFTFAYADFNKDGVNDLWAIQSGATGSGRTEVHVMDGATHFKTYLLHKATGLATTSKATWAFAVGDFNGDGTPDLSAVNTRDTGSGHTAWHVMDGRDLSTFLLHSATPLPMTTTTDWAFTSGDFNGDGRDDLYAVDTQDTGPGRTSYHVLNAANPQQYLLHAQTPLGTTSLTKFSFAAGDYNGDGRDDLYMIDSRDGGSGRTAVHVLDAADSTRWLLHSVTALGATALPTWQEGAS